jgi:hypothetical protein
MANLSFDGPTLDNPTFSFLGTTATSYVAGVAGLSSYGTESSIVVGETGTVVAYGYTVKTPSNFNYTLVVQIPIPFLNLSLDLNLLGDFILPALTALEVPKAMTWLTANVTARLQHVIDDAIKLVQAIPEATVTILVKLGPATVLNIQLVARKVPVAVPIPTFKFDLPNFAVAADFSLVLPFPAPPPVVIYVPIPVPYIALPPFEQLIALDGGRITGNATGGVYPAPVPISSPIYLPSI